MVVWSSTHYSCSVYAGGSNVYFDEGDFFRGWEDMHKLVGSSEGGVGGGGMSHAAY